MDDDWLESDDTIIDKNATHIRLLDNERDRIGRRERDQGYLDGIDWANDKYTIVARTEPEASSAFQTGVEMGIERAMQSKERLTMLAKLIVKNLSCSQE